MTFADLLPAEIETDVEDERFSVDSYEKAEWALERAGVAQIEIDHIDNQADAMIARIEEARAERKKPYQQTLEQMAYFLDPWTRAECDKAGKKTIPLAMGEVKIVSGREALTVDDDAALVEYLKKASPGLVCTTVKEAPDKTAIKKAMKDGEEFPGCAITRGPDRLELKPRLEVIAE